jgi:alkylation response protein AidB-like acyl-CoA dehydrogenase
MHQFAFPPAQFPEGSDALRMRVREFLASERAAGSFTPSRCSWMTWAPEFSRKAAQAGFVGVTIPREYGGHGLTPLHKFVVTEEMLAGGAPVGAHWIAERQSSEQILRHGTERARREILSRIAAGECYFGIGMSEPDSGSDLAAVRTRAVRAEGGWKITGTKIWTSNAHRANYLLALVRNEARSEEKHRGLTQFIIDLSHPGVTVRPIYNLHGGHDFNEVVFDGFFVEDDYVIGEVGNGWNMVTGELAFERAGPDRFMSSFQIMLSSIRELGSDPGERALDTIGRFVAHAVALRRMSGSIAGMLARGERPNLEAALVKDVGTTFEREIPEAFRLLLATEPNFSGEGSYADLLGASLLHAPGYTLRGGTREILRGIIAKGLGLR